MNEEDDIEDTWEVLRGRKVPPLVENPILGQLLKEAMEDSLVVLRRALEKNVRDLGAPVEERDIQWAQTILDILLYHLKRGLRRQTLTTCVEMILSESDISVDDLQAFVWGLPDVVIHRAVREGTLLPQKGIHALLAIESQVRAEGGSYQLSRGTDGILMVEVQPPHLEGQTISFRLDEGFTTPPEEGSGEAPV